MNALVLLSIASLATYTAASHVSVGLGEAAVLTGPSGVVSNAGVIGHGGAGIVGVTGAALGHGVLAAPAWGAGVLAAPAWGAGVVAAAPAWGAGVVARPAWGAGLVGNVGVAVGHGVGAVTNGGGTIGAGAHGAAIRGPPTAPVVVAGPSGKIAADGLWGPTANIGLTGGHGHGGW